MKGVVGRRKMMGSGAEGIDKLAPLAKPRCAPRPPRPLLDPLPLAYACEEEDGRADFNHQPSSRHGGGSVTRAGLAEGYYSESYQRKSNQGTLKAKLRLDKLCF